jgi:hypothetical protein
MDQHGDRHALPALREHQPAGQLDAAALEPGLGDVEVDALAGDAVDAKLAGAARVEDEALAVGPLGPAQRAGPRAIARRAQGAGRTIEQPVAQARLVRSEVDHATIAQAVRADMAVRG